MTSLEFLVRNEVQQTHILIPHFPHFPKWATFCEYKCLSTVIVKYGTYPPYKCDA